MRWVTFRADGDDTARAGLLVDEEVHALPAGETVIGLLGDDGERLWRAGAAQKPATQAPANAAGWFSAIVQAPAGVGLSKGKGRIVPELRAPEDAGRFKLEQIQAEAAAANVHFCVGVAEFRRSDDVVSLLWRADLELYDRKTERTTRRQTPHSINGRPPMASRITPSATIGTQW